VLSDPASFRGTLAGFALIVAPPLYWAAALLGAIQIGRQELGL